MKVGIIGTGDLGGVIARKIKDAGHHVRVANSRGIEGVRLFANEIGAVPVDVRGAVDDVDLIILSIPLPAIAYLPSDLFAGVPSAVPIVDTSNYYPGMRDPHIAEIDEGMAESVWVAQCLGRPVIKAFNNVLSFSLAHLGRPAGSADRPAIAVAGDDDESKTLVMSLVDQLGFDPVDGGTLEESWRQQPATPGYCCDYNTEEMRKALSLAVRGAAPALREKQTKRFLDLGPNASHGDLVAANRALHPLT